MYFCKDICEKLDEKKNTFDVNFGKLEKMVNKVQTNAISQMNKFKLNLDK